MNKKLIALTVSLTLGGTMLFTTAFASANETSGYDAYKAALKNMLDVKSMTDKVELSVKDNGSSLITVNSTAKMNLDSKNMSSSLNVKSSGAEETVNVFKQDDKTITKTSDSDIYNVMQLNNERFKGNEEKISPERLQSLENIVDALVGNYKNYFSLDKKADGSKVVSVKLSESQVLPVANAIASAVIRDRESFSVNEGKAANKMKVDIPKLDSDIRVTSIDLQANISKDNIIQNQTANIILVGKDAQGKEHSITANIDMNVSSLNKTTPDTVDLTGKQVKTITPEEFRHIK